MSSVMEPKKTMRRMGPAQGPISVPMFSHGVSGVEHYFGTKAEPAPAMSRAGRRTLRVVSVNQVHGTEVLSIDRPIADWAGFETAALSTSYDAIVTNQPNLLLSVRTADCVPVLFLDEARRVVAVAHAGWRGTVAGIVAKTLAVMQDRFRCHTRTIRVAIGPSIGLCCYEVDEAVLLPLKRAFPSWSDVVERVSGSRAHLDLRRLNRRQLELAGIPSSRIETVNLCTACRPELFHSYRRDGKGTGRMTSGIGLTALLG